MSDERPKEDWFSVERIITMRQAEIGVGRNELARRVGVTPHRVASALKQPNITVRVFREMLNALGMDIDVVELDGWYEAHQARRQGEKNGR